MPLSDAIVCEFPAPVDPKTSDCASPSEIADVNNVSTSEAATALATNRKSSIALDWSDEAIAACGGPRKITFLDGQYPDGSVLCLNCGTQIEAMPPVYATKDKACSAKCQDLINNGNGFKPADVAAYCDLNAHTAPNFDKKICYHGACTPGGSPNPNFNDPRKGPALVQWIDELGGASSSGTNTLTRMSPATGTMDADFNAGAASSQIIKSGDAWVEFEAGFAGVSHVLGLRESCDDVMVCPDMDPGLTGIGLSLNLHANGGLYVLQVNGQPLQVFPINGQTYALGERFRVRATDNHDKTATISFTRVKAPCVDGTICAEDPVYVSPVKLHYPLRVDSTLREQNAAVANVKIVYINQ